MFKKVVLADNLAPLVEMVYHTEAEITGPAVFLATLAFGLQIYGDFSGYSDLARGLARLLGFDIMVNFNLPYTATSLREFWHRWHISLSSWLRDYLYISLGGNRRGAGRTAANLLLTFVLGGLWHGAAWHFVLWGVYHGLGLVGNHVLTARSALSGRRAERRFPKVLGWITTMLFVLYGWLLFRAESWDHLVRLTAALGHLAWPDWGCSFLVNLACFSLPLVIVEFWQHRKGNPLVILDLPLWAKGLVQGWLIIAILFFWEKANTQFIYFQF